MHHVYVLYSEKHDKIYIGESSDVERRLYYHNEGPGKGWASRFRPWKLVYTEECKDRSQALKRENS